MSDIVDRYIHNLSHKIDTNPKFSLFKSKDPDFDKEIMLKEARYVALENVKISGKPDLDTNQILDILKKMKKSNEIAKLLERNHAYITHIREDGSLVYVYTNYGYKILKDLGFIDL